MFVLGATGFLHELLVARAERPFLLALSGTLMGLPFVLSADSGGNPIGISIIRKPKAAVEDEDEDRWSHLP